MGEGVLPALLVLKPLMKYMVFDATYIWMLRILEISRIASGNHFQNFPSIFHDNIFEIVCIRASQSDIFGFFASETWTRAKPLLLGFSSYHWLPNVFKNITFCVGTWTKGDRHSFTFCQLQSPQNIYEVSNLNVQFFSFWALNEGGKTSILPHYEVINIFTTENMHLSTFL